MDTVRPFTWKHSFADTAGHVGSLQLLLTPSHTCGAPGRTYERVSSQSPAQIGTPSTSASASFDGMLPLQSLSRPSQTSGAPGWIEARSSSQSAGHDGVPK